MIKIFIFSLFSLAFSCSQKEQIKAKPILANPDSIGEKIVGNDKDRHGCLTSAGYTWSQLRNECVRVFEAGVMLKPVKSSTMGAFVIFDRKNNAEIFVVTEPASIILQRQEKGNTFVNGKWNLSVSFSKKYVLKKGNDIIFRN